MDIEQQPEQNNQQLHILHLQIQMNAQQRRRKTMLVFLTAFSVFYLIVNFDYYTNPKKYENSHDYSSNSTTDSDTETNKKDTQYTQQHTEYIFLSNYQNLNLEGVWNYEADLEGKVKAKFYQPNIYVQAYQLYIDLYKGWFLEDYQIEIIYGLNESSMTFEKISSSAKYNFTNISTLGYQGDIYSSSEYQKCTADLQVIIANIDEISHPKIYLKSKSNCDEFQFETKLTTSSTNMETKALLYSMIVSFLNFIQILSCLKIMKDLMFQHRSSDQYSLFLFVFLMICDGYLAVLHFYLALQSDYFITPAFLQLILFGFLELKIAMYIWKERYINIQDNNNIRREIYRFYIKFYAIAILLIVLLYNFMYYNIFLIAINLYLLPQIIHLARSGQYIDFDYVFVCGLLLTRLFIPIYFRGCPENVLEAKTSFLTCTILILLTFVQLYVYYLQCQYGPRYFIPKFLRPRTHEYFVDTSTDGECAVCMANLTQQPTEQQTDNKVMAKIISLQNNKIMVTPCQHYFHSVCLTKWMQVKMNCPTCRCVLPPIV